MRQVFSFFLFFGLLLTLHVDAQQKDSLPVTTHAAVDSLVHHKDSIPPVLLSDSTLEKNDSIYAGKKMSDKSRDSLAKKKMEC